MSCIFQLPVMTNAGEDIENLALCSRRIRNAIRRKNWKAQLARDRHSNLIACLFAAVEMSLQLEVYVLWTENAHHTLHRAHSFVVSAAYERLG